jgi:hypothetical protein
MVPVKKQPKGEGPPYERCCFCRARTSYWTKLKNRSPGAQVACCPGCSAIYPQRAVPSKKAWCEAERLAEKHNHF